MSILLESGYSKYEWEIRECTSAMKLMLILKQHHSELNTFEWAKVFQSQCFSQDIYKLYEKEIPWADILVYRKVPVEYLEKHFGELDIFECSAFQPLTAAFIKKHKDVLSLDILARRDDLEKEAREMALKLYLANDDLEHHKRWDQNVMSSPGFCPKDFKGHYKDYQPKEEVEEVKEEKVEEKPKKKQPAKKNDKVKKPRKQKIIDYSALKKAELKAILEKRKVRVYYHDTIEILIKKCKESEEKL